MHSACLCLRLVCCRVVQRARRTADPGALVGGCLMLHVSATDHEMVLAGRARRDAGGQRRAERLLAEMSAHQVWRRPCC